jgi:ribosomal protein S18 acetylase RimI-like enzyme
VSWSIRAPRTDELERLREIEREAGLLFRTVGMDDIAGHEPFSIEELAAYHGGDRVWVLVDEDIVVGYVLVDIVDGAAHVEQLSVLPAYGRRGHGAALLTHVCDWARQRRLGGVTLTTFERVSWNGPYYARHGFRVLAEDEIGPELRRLREEEATHGLDRDLRVCMRREL